MVLLLASQPSEVAILRALQAAGPQLRVGAIGPGAALQLFDEAGELVATIETPMHVRVAGEAERLLDLADGPEPPYWWLELRCPASRPPSLEIALRVGQALVGELGATLWRSPE